MRPLYLSLFGCAVVFAEPKNPQVVAGSAIISGGAIESADRTIIHWSDFSIEEGERVIFSLPDPESAVLNRVLEAIPSRLMGRLESNGRVILVNPSGILIGVNGRIDTAAFAASTLDVLDRDFLANRGLIGREVSRAMIVNEGTIRSGEVCLAGFEVQNQGTVDGERSALVGASGFAIGFGPLQIRTKGCGEEFADAAHFPIGEITGAESMNMPGPTVIQAGRMAGSQVYCLGDYIDMSGTIAGREIFIGGDLRGASEFWKNAQVVRIDGNVIADGDVGGRVIAWSDGAMGFYGAISARGVEAGGFAEVSGRVYLDYKGRADLRAESGQMGTLLMDPPDIFINTNPDSPGVVVGPTYTIPNLASVDINNTDLSSQLDLSSVLIASNTSGGGTGNITVDAPVMWTMMPSTLTLSTAGTAGSITVNDAITSATGGDVVLISDVDISVLTASGQINLDTGAGSIFLTAGRDVLLEGMSDTLLVGSGKISVIANRNVTAGAAIRATLTDAVLATPQITLIADADFDSVGDVQIGTATMSTVATVRTEEGDILVQGFNVGVGTPTGIFQSNIDAGAGFVYGGILINAYNDFNMTGGVGGSAINWRGNDLIASVRRNANLIAGDAPSAYALMQGGGGVSVLAVGNDLLVRGGTANDTDAGIDGIAFGFSNEVSVLVGRDFRFEAQMGAPTNTQSAIAGFDNTMIRVGRNFFVQGGFDPSNLSIFISFTPGTVTSIFAGGNMVFQNEVTQPAFQLLPGFNSDSTDLRAGGDIQIGADIDKTGADGYIRIEADAPFADLWTETPNGVTPTNGNMAVLAGTPLASPFPVASNGFGGVLVETGSFAAASWITDSGDIIVRSKDVSTSNAPADFINGLLADQAVIATASGNIEINGFRNILIDPPIVTTGDVFIRSMNDLTVEMPITARNILLVCDEQGPNGQIGGVWSSGGAFTLFGGADLTSTGTLQIFTARQDLNSINGLLNGQGFVPGTLFVDTDTERWCVYFGGPGSGFTGPLYTIFYKDCLQQIAAQAAIVIDQFLVGLNPYDKMPGWWERFSMRFVRELDPSRHGAQQKIDRLATYFITRPRLMFFNLPKDYTDILHSEFVVQR
jgi:filamentous hemagglutinin family protein